jgi:lipid-A-disaccharide synthase
LSARLLISCGEASGDLYAGALARERQALDPTLRLAGLGGPRFAAAGGTLVDDYRDLAVTGLTEAIAKLPRSLAARRRLVADAEADRPAALVLIDFPDFNFRLAPPIKRLGVPVIYYISPQIWASRPGRLATMRAIADRVLVIFPFEAAIYESGGVPVEFVGHPLIDLATPSASRDVFLRGLGLTPSAPTVAILPGSRPNEVSRILPDLAAAARLIRRQVPGAQFLVARAPHLNNVLFDAVRTGQGDTRFAVVEGDTDTVLASADVALTVGHGDGPDRAPRYADGDRLPLSALAICCCGASCGSSPSAWSTDCRRAPVPESCRTRSRRTPSRAKRSRMLTDRDRAARIRAGLAIARARLGGSGASRRAAEAIMRVIDDRRSRQSPVVSPQS